jgi:hypothetical protein
MHGRIQSILKTHIRAISPNLLLEFFSRDDVIGTFQQRDQHLKRMVFNVQQDAALIEPAFEAVHFERPKTEPGWLVARLVQAVSPKVTREADQHNTLRRRPQFVGNGESYFFITGYI